MKKTIKNNLALPLLSFIISIFPSYFALAFAAVMVPAETVTAPKKILAKDLVHYSTRDIKDDVFYFVLPDRFSNGDTSNDEGSNTKVISQGGFDPSNKMAFHGGDLPGLTAKLPYLENLGVTAIWLTPILRNQAVQGDITGYHGYWVLDFTEIDPHLGSNADLKSFIRQAHQKNIKVFFDIITNHTADVVKYKECHGEDGSGWSESGEACPYISLAEIAKGKTYTTIVPKKNQQLKTPAWLNDPKHYHNQGDSTFQGENSLNGDFFGLDDLNTESPEVVNGMIDIYQNIISEFKPDGFRIDTVKHVNIEFWQQFIPALEQHAKQQGIANFFMFGEVYSGDPKELSSFTTKGKLPSVLDFGLQSALYQTLIEQKGTNKLAELFAQDSLYKNANELLNFTGNHDMGRFAYLLNAKEKQFNEQETSARVALATAITFFARGVPVIYYGDEQGFVGDGGNHDSRQDMMPSKVASYNNDKLLLNHKTTADENFDQQHPLYQLFASFAQIFHQHPALRHGQQQTIYSSEQAGIFALSRSLADQQYLVVFNTSAHEKPLSLPLHTNYHLLHSSHQAPALLNSKVTHQALAGLSFAIYQQR
ncbi:alpha-amylase family glycosyl hydrolase [Thalassotalea castellviae]|uniref:Alpha-amylase family glycosyl hydrolase n=1 Tax=Thalassotalea castellviae TaxID=3075612 RepID=A0ABU3A1U8_9GAMM|nr:alpha-amylase family glycosyl hydrolase [Thalassotalea sp. W431]MDT0604152.1 alpha-amylase family glycosyl hydrolase [Thalassotalea sp. W431]